MILHDLRLHGKPGFWDIEVSNGKISRISPVGNSPGDTEKNIHYSFGGALALPGFINSHDHLDFNLFPMLGNNTYKNYREWGPAIQQEHKEIINRVQNIPLPLRVKWGLYKNLLNGFTTVVHHGSKLEIDTELVRVLQEAQSLHSVGFEKYWKWKLNNPFKNKKQVVMHAGEGCDENATREIEDLIRHNFLKRKIIAVHGVAMTPQQASKLEGLVWCPATNYFMLQKTASVEQLKSIINIVFGTDSTLTSSWNSWEHFRQAMDSKMVGEDELLEMLTINPARLWRRDDLGRLQVNQTADIIILEKNEKIFNQNPSDILFVIVNGNMKLVDERSLNKPKIDINQYTRIKINNSIKYLKGDLKELSKKTMTYFKEMEFPFDIV